MSLAEVFQDSGYQVNPGFRDVQVARLEVFEDAPLFIQPTVGVPLGGGVLATLAYVQRGHPTRR